MSALLGLLFLRILVVVGGSLETCHRASEIRKNRR